MTPTMKALSDLINMVEKIMEHEGIPEVTRGRVLHTLLYGTPEPEIDPCARL